MKGVSFLPTEVLKLGIIELQDLESENRILDKYGLHRMPTHDKCYIQVSEDYNQVIAILNALPCKLDSKLSMQHSKQRQARW